MSFSAKVKDELSRQMIIFVLKSIQKMLQLQESTLHY